MRPRCRKPCRTEWAGCRPNLPRIVTAQHQRGVVVSEKADDFAGTPDGGAIAPDVPQQVFGVGSWRAVESQTSITNGHGMTQSDGRSRNSCSVSPCLGVRFLPAALRQTGVSKTDDSSVALEPVGQKLPSEKHLDPHGGQRLRHAIAVRAFPARDDPHAGAHQVDDLRSQSLVLDSKPPRARLNLG